MTSFSVSLRGTAATAPTPARARAMTSSIVSRPTNGRAASCTNTTRASLPSTASAARTESLRVAPPVTSASRSPRSLPSQSGGRSANPAGSATTTWPTSGCDVKGRSARSSIGTPKMERNCFGSPGPARTLAPAATTITPTSGGEPTGELTDPCHAHDLHPLGGDPRTCRDERPPEALARRLQQPPLHRGHGTDLPAQTDLAQKQRVRRDRAVPHARDQRRHDREVGRRLDQPHAARHVDEHVQVAERQVTAPL